MAEALDKNNALCKLSLVVKDPGARGTIDRVLTRNTELGTHFLFLLLTHTLVSHPFFSFLVARTKKK